MLVRTFVETGRSPSIREMMRVLELASPSGVQARIAALQKLGLVSSPRGKSRSHIPEGIPGYKELLALAATHPGLVQNQELAEKVANVAGILGVSIAPHPNAPEIRTN